MGEMQQRLLRAIPLLLLLLLPLLLLLLLLLVLYTSGPLWARLVAAAA